MGRIPLHYAAAGGFVECVKQLMARHGEGAALEVRARERVACCELSSHACIPAEGQRGCHAARRGQECGPRASALHLAASRTVSVPHAVSGNKYKPKGILYLSLPCICLALQDIKTSGPTPKEVREQQQSKLKRVLSGIQSEDVANVLLLLPPPFGSETSLLSQAQRQMAEQPPRPSAQPPDEALPKPTIKPFKSNPIDSTPNRLYRPSHAGSRVSQAAAPSPSTVAEEQKPGS